MLKKIIIVFFLFISYLLSDSYNLINSEDYIEEDSLKEIDDLLNYDAFFDDASVINTSIESIDTAENEDNNIISSKSIEAIYGKIYNPLYSAFDTINTNFYGYKLNFFLYKIPENLESEWILFLDIEDLKYSTEIFSPSQNREIKGQKQFSFFLSRKFIHNNISQKTQLLNYYGESLIDVDEISQANSFVDVSQSRFLLSSISQSLIKSFNSNELEAKLNFQNLNLIDSPADNYVYSFNLISSSNFGRNDSYYLEIHLFKDFKNFRNTKAKDLEGFDNDMNLIKEQTNMGISFELENKYEYFNFKNQILYKKVKDNFSGFDNRKELYFKSKLSFIIFESDIDINYVKKEVSYFNRSGLLINNYSQSDDGYETSINIKKELMAGIYFNLLHSYEKNFSNLLNNNYKYKKLFLSIGYEF